MISITRLRTAGLILPAVMTMVVFAVLISLGAWQWRRLVWKQDLIHKIETRMASAPASYDQALDEFKANGEAEYRRVVLSGTFLHEFERHVYAPLAAGPGWFVFTPLTPAGGQPSIFVNRGWVPDQLKAPASRQAGQVAGETTVIGIVRAEPEPNAFTPVNDVAANRWYWRDLTAMRSGTGDRPFAPFSLDADAAPANPGGWPRGGTTEVRITNNHLQYVVTWYGLAVTLVGVFLAFARQRLKHAPTAAG